MRHPILILGLLVLLAACEPKPSASTPTDQPSVQRPLRSANSLSSKQTSKPCSPGCPTANSAVTS